MKMSLLVIGLLGLEAVAGEVESVDVFGTSGEAYELFNQSYSVDRLNVRDSVLDFDELSFLNASVGTVKGGRSTAITINGLGYNGGFHNPSIESYVGMYIDGIYVPRHSIVSTGFIGLEEVSIVEGVKNTGVPVVSGIGTVDLKLRNPVLSENNLSVEASGGSDNFRSFAGISNIALGQKAALLLSGSIADSDGRYENFYTGERNLGAIDNHVVNAKLFSQLSDGLDVKLGFYENMDSNDWTGTAQTLSHRFDVGPTATGLFNNVIPLGYSLFQLDYTGDGEIDLPRDLFLDGTSINAPVFSDEKNRITSLDVSKEMGRYSLQYSLAMIASDQELLWDADNTDYDLGAQAIDETFDSVSHQLKFEYAGQAASVVGGFAWINSELSFDYESFVGDDLLVLAVMGSSDMAQQGYLLGILNGEEIGPSGEHLATNANNFEDADRLTVFADFSVGPTTSPFKFGFNVAEVRKRFVKATDGFCSYDTANLSIDQCSPSILRGILDPTYFRGEDESTEIVSSVYFYKGWVPASGQYIYSSLSRSEKPGGYNSMQALGFGPGLAPSIDSLRFDKQTDYYADVGYAIELGDLGSASALFYGHSIDDYQLNYFTGFGFEVLNAEQVRSFGGKVQFDVELLEGLELSGSSNYAKSYYEEHSQGLCPPIEYRTVDNCSYLTVGEAIANGESLVADMSGKDLRGPRLTSNVALKNRFQLGTISVSHNLELQYTGNRRTTEEDFDVARHDGFSVWNYNLSADVTKHVEFNLSVKNITDEREIVFEFPSTIVRAISESVGEEGSLYGLNALTNEGRSAQASIRVRF